jgi:hypothetical protein
LIVGTLGCADDPDVPARGESGSTSTAPVVTTGETGDGLALDPSSVHAGELVSVSYLSANERGVAFFLQSTDPQGDWITEYVLISDGTGSEPYWLPPERAEWVDIGLSGDVADTLVIPEVALPGHYRVCTANAPTELCGEIEIMP